MLDEKQINKLREMREKDLTVKETANALGISESSVKKYTSDNYELDEKAGLSLTKIMKEEGFDFSDEIKPLVYSLKNQANEINVDLYKYLTDVSNIMSAFLRITDKPAWFYLVFCELANSLSVITEQIDAMKLIEAVENWFNREIEIEEAEEFLTEIKEKTETLIENADEEYEYYQEKTNELKEEIESLTLFQESEKDLRKNEAKAEKLLKNTKEEYNQWLKKIKEAQESLGKITLAQTIITKKIMESPDKNNNTIKRENIMLRLVLEKINKLFPEEINVIIQEIDTETAIKT